MTTCVNEEQGHDARNIELQRLYEIAAANGHAACAQVNQWYVQAKRRLAAVRDECDKVTRWAHVEVNPDNDAQQHVLDTLAHPRDPLLVTVDHHAVADLEGR